MTQEIQVGTFTIGERRPCFIIAEAGVNHNGSLELAKRLVDAAKDAGADAVKFQSFTTGQLVTDKAGMAAYQEENTGKKESQAAMLERLELRSADFEQLKHYCDEKDIMFLSTPHTEDTLAFLDPLVALFKIGSGDLTNLPMLARVAKRGKPIILSTGMATLEETRDAIETVRRYTDELVVLHCTTSYPCPRDQVNLAAMQTLRAEFGVLVGYSDHTEGIDIPVMAVALGATVIEKHFTLDKGMDGPDHRASLTPQELKEMVAAIRSTNIDGKGVPQEILGKGKKEPTAAEIEIAKVARKSLIARVAIAQGTTITEEMLIAKRPGTGIAPKEYVHLIGKRTRRAIEADTMIEWGMLE